MSSLALKSCSITDLFFLPKPTAGPLYDKKKNYNERKYNDIYYYLYNSLIRNNLISETLQNLPYFGNIKTSVRVPHSEGAARTQISYFRGT